MHLFAQHGLGVGEAVADDLEDHVEGRQREAHHHQAALAGGVHELVAGAVEVAHQLAVALGLALPRPAQHGEQLAHRLARHDRLEEHDRLGDALQVDVEVGAGEAEHNADVVLRQHDRVHQHAAVGVLERDHQRRHEIPSDDAPDQVGARDLVEHRADHLDLRDLAPLAAPAEVGVHLAGDVGDALVEVTPRRAEAHIAQQVLEQQRQRAVVQVGVAADRGAYVRQRIELAWRRTRCPAPRRRCRTGAG